MAAGVDQGFGAVGIAAQDLRQGLPRDGHRLAVCIADQVAVVVVGQHLVRDEVADGTSARAFAVAEELDQHRRDGLDDLGKLAFDGQQAAGDGERSRGQRGPPTSRGSASGRSG